MQLYRLYMLIKIWILWFIVRFYTQLKLSWESYGSPVAKKMKKLYAHSSFCCWAAQPRYVSTLQNRAQSVIKILNYLGYLQH